MEIPVVGWSKDQQSVETGLLIEVGSGLDGGVSAGWKTCGGCLVHDAAGFQK